MSELKTLNQLNLLGVITIALSILKIIFIQSEYFIQGYSETSFFATFDTSPVTPTDPIVFNYPLHNTGGHYDPTTGIYTIPLGGTYEFIFHILANNDALFVAWLVVDGTVVSETLPYFVNEFYKWKGNKIYY